MKSKYLKLLGLIVLIGAIACVLTYAEKGKEKEGTCPSSTMEAAETERQVTEAEVPAAALAALKKLAAGAELTAFAEEVEQGHTFYEGSWKAPSGGNMDVLVTPTGDLVEIEEQVSAAQVPAAVMAAAQKAAGTDTELTFEKKTMILYEAKFNGHEQLLTPDGRCAEKEGEKGKEEEEEEKEASEEKVSLGDVPEAVKATIIQHAAGGEIKEIERETKDGKVIYEAAVIIAGKEADLKVAANGELLSEEAEDEGNED